MPSTIVTNSVGHVSDHFEPEATMDPAEAKKLRGHLEQIDYAAYAANREVVTQVLGRSSLDKFQRLAIATAHARATWVGAATTMTEKSHTLTAEQVTQLSALRAAYEELAEVYEASRRMVKRGYLPYTGPARP